MIYVSDLNLGLIISNLTDNEVDKFIDWLRIDSVNYIYLYTFKGPNDIYAIVILFKEAFYMKMAIDYLYDEFRKEVFKG